MQFSNDVIDGNINSERYIAVLEEHLLPLDLPGRGVLFQHYNATPHTSRQTQQFLAQHGLNVLPWPPQSPDLNPMENLWGILKNRLETIGMRTMEQLMDTARQEWSAIPQATIQGLIESMPRRMAAVIEADGGATKY